MLIFKLAVFIGIVIALLDSVKKVRQEKTAKNKAAVAANIVLFLLGLFIVIDAFF